jgi:hypothetical protein
MEYQIFKGNGAIPPPCGKGGTKSKYPFDKLENIGDYFEVPCEIDEKVMKQNVLSALGYHYYDKTGRKMTTRTIYKDGKCSIYVYLKSIKSIKT